MMLGPTRVKKVKRWRKRGEGNREDSCQNLWLLYEASNLWLRIGRESRELRRERERIELKRRE
jgi:hypothetical protein